MFSRDQTFPCFIDPLVHEDVVALAEEIPSAGIFPGDGFRAAPEDAGTGLLTRDLPVPADIRDKRDYCELYDESPELGDRIRRHGWIFSWQRLERSCPTGKGGYPDEESRDETAKPSCIGLQRLPDGVTRGSLLTPATVPIISLRGRGAGIPEQPVPRSSHGGESGYTRSLPDVVYGSSCHRHVLRICHGIENGA